MMAMSVSELKARARMLGVKIPKHAIEKQELLRLVEDADRRKAHAYLEADTRPGNCSVAEMKARLAGLGHDVPSNFVMESELVVLVDEAERQKEVSDAAQAVTPVLKKAPCQRSDSIPAPWYRKESRKHPGKFYYVNAETGKTSWRFPEHKRSSIREEQVQTAEVEHATTEEVAPTGGMAKEEDGENGEDSSTLQDHLKLDYRDDAFEDLQEPAPNAPAERPWSRSARMRSELGGRGYVRTLTLVNTDDEDANDDGALQRSFSQVASGSVRGSRLVWVRGEVIGRGSLGRVFKALDQSTGQIFAVKEVPVNMADDDDQKFVKELENEVEIMKDLRHPHVVSYLGHDYIDSCLYLYIEHMPGGSLTQALQQFGAFEESLVASYSKQLLDGLEYLHTRPTPIIHRDIKGSNILVGLDARLKLADFGCSKRALETLTHTMRGSIPWMAPEVIMHAKYGRAADIWSFGCVTIEMSTATAPWGKFDNQMNALFKIGMSKQTPPLPKGISELCANFISSCVKRDPTERPGVAALLQHEFVKDILPLE
eukprot:TRINITY_DN55770_c0_g1_i1.p1 TRINITY_DN55770_c0_g1~~TRINITY_DN55770_c0_g1_i1.p1  ORF type:complete len:541 (+),score=120.08 TRINITY_DN55770_c0_g1_i1:134-1756(+)